MEGHGRAPERFRPGNPNRKEATMIRNLKALGLALVAVCALGALAASSASAVTDVVTTPAGNTWVTGTSHDNKLTIPGKSEVKCTTSKYFATVKNGDTHLTVGATYSGIIGETPHTNPDCTVEGVINTTALVAMNGCDYELTGTTTGLDAGKTDATVSVICPVGKKIEIKTTAGCTVSVPTQTPTVGGVAFTNKVPVAGKVTIDITATGVTYSTNFACQLAGLSAEANDALFTGTVVTEGFVDTSGTVAADNAVEGASKSIEVT
jgi:hypothetical protein